MQNPEKPKASPKDVPEAQSAGKVIPLKRPFPPADQPDKLNDADALKLVRMIAADSDKIVVVRHGKTRQRQRMITRPQIERCVQKGSITEGPFINGFGNWQMNLTRHTAGEQITCVVAIDWATRILVITTF